MWWRANLDLLTRFPDVAWIPGFWVEYGMAAEPSAFGARVVWHHNSPPSIEPLPGGLDALAGMRPADPHEHGFMPLALQLYRDAQSRLQAEGHSVRMVAARSPRTVAGWLLGVTELMVALKRQPEHVAPVLDVLTDTIIAWLRAQAEAVSGVEGILLLDDIPGMLSPKLFDALAAPYLRPYSRRSTGWCGSITTTHPALTCCPGWPSCRSRCLTRRETDIADVRAAMPRTC